MSCQFTPYAFPTTTCRIYSWQSTPPRRRRRLQSQAIRNVTSNYRLHSKANPLDSQASADVTPQNTSQPQNDRPAKRAARDRISASSQPKRKCNKHGTPSTQVPDSQHLIIHQHHEDVKITTSHVNPLFRDDSEDLTTPPTQPLPPSKRPRTRYLRQDTNPPWRSQFFYLSLPVGKREQN